MERDKQTNELIMSRAEIGACLLTGVAAVSDGRVPTGEVASFFDEAMQPETAGLVRLAEDGRLALNKAAEETLRNSLAVDAAILGRVSKSTDTLLKLGLDARDLPQIVEAQSDVNTLSREFQKHDSRFNAIAQARCQEPLDEEEVSFREAQLEETVVLAELILREAGRDTTMNVIDLSGETCPGDWTIRSATFNSHDGYELPAGADRLNITKQHGKMAIGLEFDDETYPFNIVLNQSEDDPTDGRFCVEICDMDVGYDTKVNIDPGSKKDSEFLHFMEAALFNVHENLSGSED